MSLEAPLLHTKSHKQLDSNGVASLTGALGATFRPKQFRRPQYAVVLVLAPVNESFEKKSLVVPFYPEVLKLGRQTNVKTMASPENGFFDSRVLSRQHAEIWADRATGKVWLKDCKSSNGTYLNKQRLSGENTESDPFELKKSDLLDLGIDIACDDKSSVVYKKISARVDRVSMMPLHATPTAPSGGSQTSSAASLTSGFGSTSTLTNGKANGSNGSSAPALPQRPSISRSPSLATLKASEVDNEYANSIFGAPNASLETMALLHARNTVGGMVVKPEIVASVEFELATKRLVSEINAAKVDTAKISSVKSLLRDIQSHQTAENPELVSLKEQVKKLRYENATLQAALVRFKTQHPPQANVRTRKPKEKLFRPSDVNNFVLLLTTTILMVITGFSVMIFFNPPTG